MKWVRQCRYCELTGETRDSVRQKIIKGYWREGFHYKKLPADGKIWIHTERVDEWLEGLNGPPA